MDKRKAQLIVALDVGTLTEAKKLIKALSRDVEIFKVGSQLFTLCGPQIVRDLLKAGKKVFLDLKFHDIPNTVANAVEAAVGLKHRDKTIFMCTLHTQGGKEMLQRAVEAAAKASQAAGVKRPLLLGITVLTSDAKEDSIGNLVLERALLAKEAGLDGVVASSQEAAMIRQRLGDDFIIVTPGIRPAGAEAGDQKRVTTPAQAQANGSDFLVVGRPVVKAENPSRAATMILEELDR
ncbi:MAG TPA: orotidine-5'-phosphate decarboxylase [Candidatus Omnitrophota bacterium]|nr:orotidine-5'-phosphate decarboxylase [Candidatus Omnitrophota bacterium]